MERRKNESPSLQWSWKLGTIVPNLEHLGKRDKWFVVDSFIGVQNPMRMRDTGKISVLSRISILCNSGH